MDKIKCPHCGKQVELSEAIVHELQAKVREEETKKLKAQFEEEKAKEATRQEKQLREEFEKSANDEEERKKAEEKIREDVLKDSRLERLELEKKLRDTQGALDNAQRKAKQGSQQLQGDVLEQDLETRLREAFPYDEFKPVPTGIRGGDIIHEVKNKHGNIAGKILWDAKRQKAWNKAW